MKYLTMIEPYITVHLPGFAFTSTKYIVLKESKNTSYQFQSKTKFHFGFSFESLMIY